MGSCCDLHTRGQNVGLSDTRARVMRAVICSDGCKMSVTPPVDGKPSSAPSILVLWGLLWGGLPKQPYYSIKSMVSGGSIGIRTLETVPRLHTFQACAFDHSATDPLARSYTRGWAGYKGGSVGKFVDVEGLRQMKAALSGAYPDAMSVRRAKGFVPNSADLTQR